MEGGCAPALTKSSVQVAFMEVAVLPLKYLTVSERSSTDEHGSHDFHESSSRVRGS